MTIDKKTAKKPTRYRIYTQYILVGVGIGLYYGIFYWGTNSAPDYGMAVILSVLAGVITTAVRNWKKKKVFGAIALDFVKITATFMAFLLALQLNSVLEAIGGRTLVIVFMTILGIIFGLIIGVRRKPVRQDKP
jgi:hypothetical protein